MKSHEILKAESGRTDRERGQRRRQKSSMTEEDVGEMPSAGRTQGGTACSEIHGHTCKALRTASGNSQQRNWDICPTTERNLIQPIT